MSPSPPACPPFPSPETHVFCKEILGLGFNLQGGCGDCLSWGTSTQTSLLGERDRLGYVFTGCFFKAGQPLRLTPCFLPSICPHSRNLGVSFCVCVRGRRVAPGCCTGAPCHPSALGGSSDIRSLCAYHNNRQCLCKSSFSP